MKIPLSINSSYLSSESLSLLSPPSTLVRALLRTHLLTVTFYQRWLYSYLLPHYHTRTLRPHKDTKTTHTYRIGKRRNLQCPFGKRDQVPINKRVKCEILGLVCGAQTNTTVGTYTWYLNEEIPQCPLEKVTINKWVKFLAFWCLCGLCGAQTNIRFLSILLLCVLQQQYIYIYNTRMMVNSLSL